VRPSSPKTIHSLYPIITEKVDLLAEPHPYYKELLCWDTTSMTLHIATLADAIVKNDLHICADGAYRGAIGQGSHAWVFSTSTQDILWKGAGPAIGHPDLMTPYRAELAGLTSVLFVLHLISHQKPVDKGSVTIYCDNAAALNEIFAGGLPSNNPYNLLAADKDLITTARDLLLQLPITVSITHQWVKGHYKGKRELKHELNNLADELAGEFNELGRPKRSAPPLLPPYYEAELIKDNYTVSSRLAKVIRSAMHEEQL
jgi:ribonuclease HI